MKTYIAIDWGLRKIGTSFGDDQTKIAFSGVLFENDRYIFECLGDFARKYSAQTFLLGTTRHRFQSDNAAAIKQFARQLTQQTGLSVVLVEEMFSTKQAQANLKEAGKNAHDDDVESSRVLLQDFLDQ